MINQDQIIEFIRQNGPSLPTAVAKYVQSDTIIAAAHLADLSSRGKLKISSLKIGASPLYYLPEQQDKLYPFAAGNINPKDLAVLEKIRLSRVLRESDLELLEKVSLRTLKDFAVPLHVTVKGMKSLFWKYSLATDEEVNEGIKKIITYNLDIAEEVPLPPIHIPKEKIKMSEPDLINVPQDSEIDIDDLHNRIKVQDTPIKPIFVHKNKEHKTPEEVRRTSTDISKASEEANKKSSKLKVKEHQEEQKKLVKEQEKPLLQPLLQKAKDKVKAKKVSDDMFVPELQSFFDSLDIIIDDHEIIRKNAESNFILRIPSVIGKVTYYCKAKDKARCDEKDLSAAYMEAQLKKLPLLFLYTRSISKKAQEMLDSGAFENAIVKKMESLKE